MVKIRIYLYGKKCGFLRSDNGEMTFFKEIKAQETINKLYKDNPNLTAMGYFMKVEGVDL